MINRNQHLDVSFACGQEFLICFQQSVFGPSSYELNHQLLKVEILVLMLRLAPKTDSFCKHISEMFTGWCLKTTFKFTKHWVDFCSNFVIWSGHWFLCVYFHSSKQCVSLGVLWMHISVLLHVIYKYMNIQRIFDLPSYQLVCYLYRSGHFFYFKRLPPGLHVLYWCTVLTIKWKAYVAVLFGIPV